MLMEGVSKQTDSVNKIFSSACAERKAVFHRVDIGL